MDDGQKHDETTPLVEGALRARGFNRLLEEEEPFGEVIECAKMGKKNFVETTETWENYITLKIWPTVSHREGLQTK